MTHHKRLPAKKRRIVSRRVKLAIQLSLCLLPLAASLFLPPYEEISRQIIIIIAAYLATFGIISFLAAWLLEPTSRTRSRASRG